MATTATLDLMKAERQAWDAVVIGAGPAGALAAREVARRGGSVLLVDKASFPRWKVCGCCFNLRALGTLAAVGLDRLMDRVGAREARGLAVAAGSHRALVPLAGERVVSRSAFDNALVESAVDAGAEFLPETQARLGAATISARQVTLRHQGREMLVLARVVIAAHGLTGGFGEEAARTAVATGSRLGAGVLTQDFPDFYRQPIIFMACGTGGYVGLVQLEDGRLNIAAALDPDGVKQADGLGEAAARVLEESLLPPIPGLANLSWRGTPLLTRSASVPASERVFLVGDAAGYVEPFTGEGIAWALASAAAVGPLAYRASRRWDAALARQWSTRYRQTILRRQWLCRSVAYTLRHPALTRVVVRILSKAPSLAAPLVRYFNRLDP
jgi:flavin-dependent dehydrogenase